MLPFDNKEVDILVVIIVNIVIAKQTDPGRDLIEVASLEDGTRRRLLREDQVNYDEQRDDHINDHHHHHHHCD